MSRLKTDSHLSTAYKILPHLKSFGINKYRKTEKNTVSLSLCDFRPLNCKKTKNKFTDEMVSIVLKRDTGQRYKKVKL